MRKNNFDLKKFREEHKITQQEVAALCKVSLRTVQSWESNNTMPDKYFAQLRSIKSIKGNVITQVWHGDYSPNVNGSSNNVKPSVDAMLDRAMLELAELRKALTDALIVNQRHTDRLLTIIENEQAKTK